MRGDKVWRLALAPGTSCQTVWPGTGTINQVQAGTGTASKSSPPITSCRRVIAKRHPFTSAPQGGAPVVLWRGRASLSSGRAFATMAERSSSEVQITLPTSYGRLGDRARGDDNSDSRQEGEGPKGGH